MRTEHCTGLGSTLEFTTRNYGITTCPSKEWNIVHGTMECPPEDMVRNRRIPSVDELLESSKSKEAKLNRAEVVAIVLYSGPMVRSE